MQKYDDGKPRDLPYLFKMLVSSKDHKELESLLRSSLTKIKGNVGISGLTSMLECWPTLPNRVQSSVVFRAFKSQIVRESVVISLRQALTASQLKVLVDSAKEDAKSLKRITDIAAAPPLLKAIQTISVETSWEKLQAEMLGMLNPFRRARVEVPRLETTCAASLLRLLKKVQTPSSACGLAAAILEFREGSLVSMPGLVEVVATHLSQCSLPSTSAGGI